MTIAIKEVSIDDFRAAAIHDDPGNIQKALKHAYLNQILLPSQ